jgi:hypothetical protein
MWGRHFGKGGRVFQWEKFWREAHIEVNGYFKLAVGQDIS